jgi:hypothetical protein
MEITTARKPLLASMFRDKGSAELAYNNASARGYSTEDINIIMSDNTRKSYLEGSATSDKVLKGIGTGSAIGGALGAIAAALMATGTSISIPGFGLVIAGPMAAVLAGAGAGGVAGGIIGALASFGIPKEDAEKMEHEFQEGAILIGVEPRNQIDRDFLSEAWSRNKSTLTYQS